MRRGPAPHLVAATASSLVLVVGVAVTAYFVELRGIGLRAELQGARALEIEILGGALLAIALVTQFAVAHVVRGAGSSGNERRLLRRALEADYADPDLLNEFVAVPELRDLVGMLMAERTQVRELGDRVETLTGEFGGLVDGMRRTSGDLGRLRQEGLSQTGMQVVEMWNAMLERIKAAEAAGRDARAAVAAAPVSAPATPPEVSKLVARLDELESDLDRLQRAMHTPTPVHPPTPMSVSAAAPAPAPVRASAPAPMPVSAPAPALAPVQAAALATPVGPAAPQPGNLWKVRTTATIPVGEDDAWGTVQPVEAAPTTARWNAPKMPTQDLFFTDEPAAAAAPERDDPAPFRSAPAPAPAAPVVARASSTSLRPAAEPAGSESAPSFDEIDFPHFVGRPVRSLPDRVEVTYEAQTGEEVVELPSSALMFESESEPEAETEAAAPAQSEDGVLDLGSLGALEFDR